MATLPPSLYSMFPHVDPKELEEHFERKQEAMNDYEDNYEFDYNGDYVRKKQIKTEVQTRKEQHDELVTMDYLWGDEKYILPFDIMLNIFSRLSAEEILICKQVIRPWRHISRLTHFADLHIQHKNGSLQLEPQQQPEKSNGAFSKVSFLLLTMEKSSPLCYLEYDEIKNSYNLTRINHPLIKKRANSCALVGSCNGLLCFSLATRYNVDDPVSIYNPITREFLQLSRFEMPPEFLKSNGSGKRVSLKRYMVNGFGYHPSSDEYKIVRIFYGNEQAMGRVEVYTLGTRKEWRNKGEIGYSLFRQGNGPSRGILVDGFLYWLDYKDWKIVAFDLGVEEFSLLPAPPCYISNGPNYFQLQVIGGFLCVVKEILGEGVKIWSFKRENGEWESRFNLKINLGCRNLMDVNWPITLLRNGGVLLRYMNTLVLHDTKTATWGNFLDLNPALHLDKPLGPSPLVEAIPHIHSFVSLKVLDYNTKKRKKNEYDSD